MAKKRKTRGKSAIRGGFCERTVTPISKLDKKSLRWKEVPANSQGSSWLIVGCPKGKFNSKKQICKVGTKAYKILTPTKGRCKVGKRLSK